ncbi:HXXXD-type acyl-transferase family protein [Perilla frutescens var. hirtella]|uniref:HXXXD-type acyl-transferase family protein n=1 Tax=Perilla frutescens var. hirtella TaxID=608512 RepID=A0AAD4JIH9_PERFH|nr:HXXXD-type acyl-transferase family protein [Perilla frutescens var. hirtella]
MKSAQSLTFKVTRKIPELIAPAKPTPHEFKPLSDIDNLEVLRLQIPAIQIYRRNPSAEGKDPVKVIRNAIAKTLVFYYPFAGRLRECSGGKLVVECTGEGVLFIEADADVTLQQFGDAFYPPFPCKEDLLYDVPASAGVLNCPLLLIQVTRLKCGGFIFTLRHNHTMSDAIGAVQFMSAIGEVARGAAIPSISPVWDRHLLNAREASRVTCTHHVHTKIPDTEGTLTPPNDMVHRSFFFGIDEFSALRSHLPLHLGGCSTFELLTACLWRCRTIAISPQPNEEVRIFWAQNFREQCNLLLPVGYYGNVITFPIAISTADELSRNPLHYALELVRESKIKVMEELKKSSVDQLVIRGKQTHFVAGSYAVSDLTRVGFEEVDFGWGKPVYGGPMEDTIFSSHYIPFKNNGEIGKMVPVCLPANAMEVFVKELEEMLKGGDHQKSKPVIKSAL